jgi:hypothetical protein
MCYRGSRAGADDRKFAGFESVEGGVRGNFIVSLGGGSAILVV